MEMKFVKHSERSLFVTNFQSQKLRKIKRLTNSHLKLQVRKTSAPPVLQCRLIRKRSAMNIHICFYCLWGND